MLARSRRVEKPEDASLVVRVLVVVAKIRGLGPAVSSCPSGGRKRSEDGGGWMGDGEGGEEPKKTTTTTRGREREEGGTG